MRAGHAASLLAIVFTLALTSFLGLVAPAASSAEEPTSLPLYSAEAARSSWASAGAFERAAAPRLEFPSPKELGFQPDATLLRLGLVRFLKALPLRPVSIGPVPRMPYENEPVMGMVFVYRFGDR